MQIILVKYIQLFCVTLFFNNNVKCDQLLLKNDNEDRQIYGISACVGRCIKNNENLTLEQCYENCVEFLSDKNYEEPKKIYRNFEIRFLCRDDTSFVIEIVTKNYNNNNNSSRNSNSSNNVINNKNKIDNSDYNNNSGSNKIFNIDNNNHGIYQNDHNDNKTFTSNNNTNDYNYEMDYNEDDYIAQQQLLQQQKQQEEQEQQQQTEQYEEEQSQNILQYSTVFDDENYDDNTSSDRIYVLKIHEKNKFPIEKQIYLTNSNLIKIDNLQPNTKYHISATVAYPNNEYSLIASGLIYNTLKKKYLPKKITNVKIDYITDEFNLDYLSAKLSWKPAADQTCYYDIVWYSPEIMTGLDISPIEIRDIEHLYTYTIKNLSFGTKYQVAVRGKNTKDLDKESELVWHQIETPTCLDWYQNNSICPPHKPEKLNAIEEIISENEYKLNISWKIPNILPDYYTIQIRDLNRNLTESNIITKNVSKEMSSIYLPNIILKGLDYEVNLTAYSDGGTSSSIIMVPIQNYIRLPENFHLKKITIGILILILCIIIILIAVLLIYLRFIKIKRLKERCHQIENIKKEKPIDQNLNFELTSDIICGLSTIIIDNIQQNLQQKLFINDDKEIDPNNLKLLKILGEGAFGLVRHGILKIDETKSIDVAVKMLKDRPSSEDIKSFRREIDVMKSVGYHPNIVGIIGHYTKNINEFMLLTEYCSLGNLQNFLRSEWKHISKVVYQKLNRNLKILQNDDDINKCDSTKFNYNNSSMEKNQINYKNVTFNGDTTLSLVALPLLTSFSSSTSSSSPSSSLTSSSSSLSLSSKMNNITTSLQITIKENLLTTTNTNTTIATTTTTTAAATNTKTTTTADTTNKILQNTDNIIDSSDKIMMNQKNLITDDITVFNNGYELNGLCTNSCKCKVDIILKNYCYNLNEIKNEQKLKNYKNKIDNNRNDYDNYENDDDNNNNSYDETDQDKDNHKTENDHNNKICIPEIDIQNCDCNNIEKRQLQQRQRQRQFEKEQEQIHQHKKHSQMENENQNEINKKLMTLKNKNFHKITANNKNESKFVSVAIDDTINIYDCQPLTNLDLLLISKQIALGMEFLSKNKVVHRDLAARNVLVCSDRNVKIADFGLSRDVYQENIYKKTGDGKLPIKWLAIESMTHQVYTTQSDVWSYGILLYEIVTLGGSPYPSIPNSRLLNLLKSGYRMDKPKTCGEEFYSLMLSCWDANPNKRPTFTNIVKKMDEFLTDQPNKHIFNNLILTEFSDNNKTKSSVSSTSYLEPI